MAKSKDRWFIPVMRPWLSLKRSSASIVICAFALFPCSGSFLSSHGQQALHPELLGIINCERDGPLLNQKWIGRAGAPEKQLPGDQPWSKCFSPCKGDHHKYISTLDL